MIWIWSAFVVFVLLLLALDLGVFHRQAHVVKTKEALALVLILVGVKMMAHSWLKGLLGANFNLWVLLLVISVLAGGVIASLAFPDESKRRA